MRKSTIMVGDHDSIGGGVGDSTTSKVLGMDDHSVSANVTKKHLATTSDGVEGDPTALKHAFTSKLN